MPKFIRPLFLMGGWKCPKCRMVRTIKVFKGSTFKCCKVTYIINHPGKAPEPQEKKRNA